VTVCVCDCVTVCVNTVNRDRKPKRGDPEYNPLYVDHQSSYHPRYIGFGVPQLLLCCIDCYYVRQKKLISKNLGPPPFAPTANRSHKGPRTREKKPLSGANQKREKLCVEVDYYAIQIVWRVHFLYFFGSFF
jgi:hypothetical protein